MGRQQARQWLAMQGRDWHDRGGRMHYNDFAGQSVERLGALSDGLFAVAMTLLVLDLRVPASDAIHSELGLGQALLGLAPHVVVYLTGFLTLGIFWVGQQTQLNHLARSDRNLSWLHIGFLFLISLMPFSTSLMAEFIAYRVALLTYWFNILLIGAALFITWLYALRAGLVRSDLTPHIRVSVMHRIVIAQGLYAFGAMLCVLSPYWSIAFTIVIQLNYAIAPRLGILGRI
jgi:uncharacterized membrane protein